MGLVDSRTGIEVIDRKGCLELLAADHVGRLAVLEGGAPLILPVNYALDGDQVVFRTAPGTKLDVTNHGAACFEIDHFERSSRAGWSVVVRGRLEEVTVRNRPRWDRIQALPDPWAEGEKAHVLALVPQTLTGRRVSAR